MEHSSSRWERFLSQCVTTEWQHLRFFTKFPLRKKTTLTLIDLYKRLCICSRALPLILLRPGSHIVNQRSGCSQPQLRQGTVIKLDGAMWKRHRALNALAGDNMSAMRTDHMGSPCLLGMPAALRHCGELCHLVNPKGEMRRRARSQWAVWQHVSFSFFFLCSSPEAERAQRREHGVWDCTVLNKKA